MTDEMAPPTKRPRRSDLAAISVEAVELRWLDLHLRHPHVTSYGVEEHRPLILVRVITTEADGWGECGALARPNYSEEHAAGAWLVLRDHLAPLIVGGQTLPADPMGAARQVQMLMSRIRGNHMAKAALEMAVVDAVLRSVDESLASSIGLDPSIETVEAGAVAATMGSGGSTTVEALVREVGELLEAGYRRVKCKIGPGWDLVPLRALRAEFGSDLVLIGDANGSYSWPAIEAGALAGIDEIGLVCLEQPLDPDDLTGHARLAAELETPICLDESIASLGAVEVALALHAAGVVSIKPARVGGIVNALAVSDRCQAVGVPVWCGGMLETGLARAANATLCALPGFSIPGDLGGEDRFLEGDPCGALVVEDGRARIYRGPGVGPPPTPRAINQLSTKLELLR